MATIYDSFNEALPLFRRLGDQIETRAKSSGTTTKACIPPMCGIKIPVEHWNDLASRLCLDQHQEYLRSIRLYPVDKSMVFKSEADVVEASASYLRQHVQLAYQLIYPDDVCLKQVTKPQNDTDAASRVDIAYFFGLPSNEKSPGKSTNVFAMLEYKRFKSLARDEFREKTVSNSDDYAGVVEYASFVDSQTNAEMALKQATHYASKYKSPFVALCDYHTLILLVMNQVEGYDGGQYTYLTVVEDSVDMRKAYLGFLLAARLHAQGKNDWRKSGAGDDLFVDAENWERAYQSSRSAKTHKARKNRNPNPKHDVPSSQESDSSKTMGQSD